MEFLHENRHAPFLGTQATWQCLTREVRDKNENTFLSPRYLINVSWFFATERHARDIEYSLYYKTSSDIFNESIFLLIKISSNRKRLLQRPHFESKTKAGI